MSLGVGPSFPARYWHPLDDGRIQCDLCPRECRLREGQRGFCFVRANSGGALQLTTYGRSSGFCIDPIEKKPLNHFYPGTSVLSFGTAGCNLGCRFCQNHDISKAREMDRLQDAAGPDDIARAAAEMGCRSVAYTYNDPVIFTEYAIDVAGACRARGLRNVAVTAGYVQGQARRDFFSVMDAANVDLKGFTEDFYQRLTGARLSTVLETLSYLVHETSVWVEITTLVIPGHNDDPAQLRALSRWVATELGPDVPLHFSAFHPDHRMREVRRTPLETLVAARDIARAEGVRFVYTGNVHHRDGDTTCCPGCGTDLIVRDWYEIRSYRLTATGRCPRCDAQLPGRYDAAAGSFGARRIPLRWPG
ncbi:MAG: AmmeMemoRadiSam system radical SAM enzyme [Actinobacteria bacterium]|nr:AmmeMemoRadiSam system radical SAM enzyme [Actinomycetota bacterium]